MNNFQIQQSLLYNKICSYKRPFGAYNFYRTIYNAKKHFESAYPRIRKYLAYVHFHSFKHYYRSMYDNRTDYKIFVEEYRKDCINAVHAELKCVTRNIDSEPCIMAYVKQRKSIPRVQKIISSINDLLCKLYRELLSRLCKKQRFEQSIIEKEESMFLSDMQAQEYWILQERDNTDTINELTPFEKPHDIEWRPKQHCSFTENTQITMHTLLLVIRRMQKSKLLPSLDPIVLEEAFSTLRISDEPDLSDSDDSVE